MEDACGSGRNTGLRPENGGLQIPQRSGRAAAVPQGRPKIAQHFSAGFAYGEPNIPDRDDRGVVPWALSSLSKLVSQKTLPQH